PAAIVTAALALYGSGRPRFAAVRAEPRTPAERAMTLALADDVWNEDPLVVVVAQDALGDVPHQVVVADIDAVADAERTRLAQRNARDWFAEYRDLDEIARFMAALAERPGVRVRAIGESVERRPIRAIEISHGGAIRIALDGGHHAREWISVMVPL